MPANSRNQRRIQRKERQRAGRFVIDRDASIVIADHAAHKPGNYRKQFLQVAVRNQCVVYFQQHVQSFFFPDQGLAGQGVLHRHRNQFCHARQKAHILFAVCVGLRTSQTQRAQSLVCGRQGQPAVGLETFLAQHSQHGRESRVRRQVRDDQRLLSLPSPPRR